MIANLGSSWLSNRLFLSAPEEMRREQCGENEYQCESVKGWETLILSFLLLTQLINEISFIRFETETSIF